MEIDDDEEGMDIDVMEIWVPQHLDQPQDSITFNQFGSTTNYLRATGPDIQLSVEEILAGIQNSGTSPSSDDLGVVSFERVIGLTVPSFILKAFQKILDSNLRPAIREQTDRMEGRS